MMQCYFYAPPTNDQAMRGIYQRIRQPLERPDIFLSTNMDEDIRVDADTLAASRQENAPVLERMDAFIIEGTHGDADTGYLLAHAIALKKPTLYLYQRGTVAKVFSHLSLKELPTWVQVVSYHDKTLEKHVDDFMVTAGGKTVKPAPRIKFTLRITNAIEEYLHYRTHNTKESKADYLRAMIERVMDDDHDWQAYLRQRRSDRSGEGH